MRQCLRVFVLCAALASGAARAEAAPMLQLDVNGPSFTLAALLTPGPGWSTIDALVGTSKPSFDHQRDSAANVNRGMVYGTPSLEELDGQAVPDLADSSDLTHIVASLPDQFGLDSDLYDKFSRTNCIGSSSRRNCSVGEDIDRFRPFSHDAAGIDAPGDPGDGVPPIPEPASLLLLATGLAISANRLRRRPTTRS